MAEIGLPVLEKGSKVGHMAFCTNCGADVKGAFCQQCGTPSSASASQAAAPPMAPPPAASMMGAPATGVPVKKKTSVVVWILLGIGAVIVLGIIGVVAAGVYLVKNPGAAMAKIIQAGNPDIEVLDTDTGSQTLRVRDRKTGKEFTLSFDDIKNGRLKMSATGDNGEVANVEIGGGEGKLPKWVPSYPGAKAQANITAKGEDAQGMGEGGVVTFTSSDSPSKVFEFYQEKVKEMGMTVDVSQASDSGGMIVARDEGAQRTLHVVVAGGNETTMTVTFGRKR